MIYSGDINRPLKSRRKDEKKRISSVEEMRYILNSAVITTPGRYSYRLITLDEAIAWLVEGDYLSTVGYQETCDALQSLTGANVPCNRRQIQMQAGDAALVFRLTCRLSDPTLKGKIKNLDFVLTNSEIGILTKDKEGGENNE